MPVLTCPFKAIAAKQIKQAKITYPEKTVLETELTITPVAGETWKAEGLSLSFGINYLQQYYINTQQAFESLEAIKTHLKEQLELLTAQIKFLEAVFVKTSAKEGVGSIPTEEAGAALEAARGAVKAINSEQSKVFQELAELGYTAAIEAIKAPALTIIARLYARGNELVWNDELSPTRIMLPKGFNRKETFSIAFSELKESLNMHTQYDDPIEFGERENLKLTLEFIGPPLPFGSIGEEGPEVGKNELAGELELSEVSATINYSH